MKKLDKTERKFEMLKLLQGKEMRTGELAEYFDVDDRTIREDIKELREGTDFFGSKIKIESKHAGNQKHYYKSTVHPIILGLNLSELFMLLKLLEEKSKGNGGEVYRNIFKNIYSQITNYSEERIAPKLEGEYSKTEIINILEEEAFRVHKGYQLAFWNKSGKFIEISYLDENKNPISEEVRLISIKDNELKIEGKDGKPRWIDYSDIVIDWSAVDYK